MHIEIAFAQREIKFAHAITIKNFARFHAFQRSSRQQIGPRIYRRERGNA